MMEEDLFEKVEREGELKEKEAQKMFM